MVKNDYLIDSYKEIFFFCKDKTFMKNIEILKTLKLLYAGLMADTMWLLEKYDVLEPELKQKTVEHTLSAPARVRQLKLNSPADIFVLHNDLIGFANWKVKETNFGVEVSAHNCTLCNICKSMNTLKPCDAFCTIPLNALCEALKNPCKLEVNSTLWEKDKCSFNITFININ